MTKPITPRPKAKALQKLLEAKPTDGAAADGAPVFRITSTSLDRHRDRVLAVKAKGEEFKVPLLWNHDSWNPAIGYARCYRKGTDWLMTPVFDEVCDISKAVAAKVQAGTLDQCSIRFIPADSEPVPNAEGGDDYPLVEVLEVSIVNIGANQDAVRLRSAEPVPEDEDEEAKYRAAGLAFRAKVEQQLEELKAQVVKLHKLLPEEEPEDEESTEEGEESPEEEERDAPEEEQETASADEEPAPEDDDEEQRDGEDTEDEETASVEDEDDEEPLAEEEAKALRARLMKRLGFTPAQAKALTSAELRAYAAHLPAAK
ncbi:HK97 family phage prohead protease [Myxococcus faecalis]|uniref:HK97 family phage prohead protease n=1 Tax=Myxococcus faecalis TaxID=3115646 RepID=UPI003CE97158